MPPRWIMVVLCMGSELQWAGGLGLDLVDVFFASLPNGRGKLLARFFAGTGPRRALLVLEGSRHAVGCQAEQVPRKEECSLSSTPPILPGETLCDHCDDPHSSSPPTGLYWALGLEASMSRDAKVWRPTKSLDIARHSSRGSQLSRRRCARIAADQKWPPTTTRAASRQPRKN